MDKFNGEKFSLGKYKMEMVLAFMNFWDIVNDSKHTSSTNADPK